MTEELSSPARKLLTRVDDADGSLCIKKREARAAKELVDKEYCYYASDYEHICAYKYQTHLSGSST